LPRQGDIPAERVEQVRPLGDLRAQFSVEEPQVETPEVLRRRLRGHGLLQLCPTMFPFLYRREKCRQLAADGDSGGEAREFSLNRVELSVEGGLLSRVAGLRVLRLRDGFLDRVELENRPHDCGLRLVDTPLHVKGDRAPVDIRRRGGHVAIG
jgi:hypothetical protein